MSRSFGLCLAALNFLAAGLAAPHTAQAETFSTCSGFIVSLPTVISTQGTWCLKQDLATAVASGSAITINTNNVTIDCNNFKLGGLAAGLGTSARGIYAQDRLNATVRHCNIRGFETGIYFGGTTSGGHVIEDNAFDGNTYGAMYIQGDGSLVQRNRVFDTGGATTGPQDTTPIWTVDSVDIFDNTVANVFTSGASASAYGIYTDANKSGRIIGNGVRGVVASVGSVAYGIRSANSDRVTLRDNDVVGDATALSKGLRCTSTNGRARDNVVSGFGTGIDTCSNDGGNVVVP